MSAKDHYNCLGMVIIPKDDKSYNFANKDRKGLIHYLLFIYLFIYYLIHPNRKGWHQRLMHNQNLKVLHTIMCR